MIDDLSPTQVNLALGAISRIEQSLANLQAIFGDMKRSADEAIADNEAHIAKLREPVKL